jgi:hypothetical protein
MREMLANRYLLNGQATRARKLYQDEMERRPGEETLACRMIASVLASGDAPAALEEITQFVHRFGRSRLLRLAEGCQGYLGAFDGAGSLSQGLRLLLTGDVEAGVARLREVDPAAHPAVIRLLQLLARGS